MSKAKTTGTKRNKKWNRDELILALDLYFKARPKNLDKTDTRVIALSKILNGLPSARSALDPTKFRNPNGVAMKCGNYKRFDPRFVNKGQKGLPNGNHLEEVVWNEFASDPVRLAAVAEAIRKGASEASTEPNTTLPTEAPIDPDEEFQEGAVLTRLHKRRERDPKASAKKKAAVLQETGRLQCEACRFDFAVAYGELGIGFAECHHRLPLASLGSRMRTRLADLAILCANCHRMIHKTRPLMSVEEFKRVVIR
jgi:5-methylcytosine-specific restriction protein A